MRVRGWPDCGYVRLRWHPDIYCWAQAARAVGTKVAQDPAMQATWLQCEGTWFVGVDALPTNPTGAISGVGLPQPVTDLIGARTDLHPAQLSITYTGYPRPREGESNAAFRYRYARDAAHMDGVLADGAPKRRFLRECHDWILGIPLTEATPGASPLVVWEGSHHLLQQALQNALLHIPEEDWPTTDITDIYTQTRKTVFTTCRRVRLFTRPGEAVLLNPFLLHGVAPWQPASAASRHGRMVAYLRPETRESRTIWLRRK